jgi:ankyrin repeat protein
MQLSAPTPQTQPVPKVPFFELVKTGTPEQVQAAMLAGANVNAREIKTGATALMYAAAYNQNPEVVMVLLTKADPRNAFWPDAKGWTPLMYAAWNNPSAEVIAALLKAGADTRAGDKQSGMTALMCAAQRNQNPDVVTALLEAGANAKSRDKFRKTALDYAEDNPKLRDTDAYRQLQEASR